MGFTRGEKGLSALIVVTLLGVILMIFSPDGSSRAAPPVAGLEKHTKANVTCQSCHKESPPKQLVPTSQCLTCHGDMARLIARSSKAVPNPHASPHLEPGQQSKCEECHHIHKPSEVSCYVCHKDYKYSMP